jgi:tetratricopeptide (TPR) repeat protein
VPGNGARAACGQSEIDLQLGDYTAGIARLRAGQDQGRRQVNWHVCLAALLAEVGDLAGALDHNRQAVSLDDNHLRARWQLGRIYETLGRTQDAVEAYRIFEERLTDDVLPENAEELTYLGQGFLRYTALTEHPNIVRRTRHVLQEVYQEAFHHVDPLYWPARLAAAELLLEKHDLAEAKGDFEQVREQNPRVPAAYVGLGRIALQEWDFEEAEKQAAAALKVNPHHVAAQVLLAETRLTERRYTEAAEVARQALATNPNSIEALSALAAAQSCCGDQSGSQETRRRVLEINPRPAVLHHVLGIWLSAERQFARAEAHFKQAIDFAPTWAEPRTELGLLYMETGQEASARKVLEAAFARDSFNNRTYHVLQLLDRLEKFARLRTEHFVIKYDEKEDAVVAPYFAEALEEMYAELCEIFDAWPEQPTIVELFPDHLGFSRRIAGRPFVATIGACTGRVIALMGPREGGPFGRFNWKTVLRHEFAHVVTLGATENRIPHWMTEGLAVGQEPSPRSWSAKQLLSEALRRNRLFNLETIDWAFVRPRRPTDRGQAYAQSEWMIEFIVGRHGWAAVLGFLKAFRDGQTQPEAFRQVLKIEPEQFDRDFQAWAASQVESWGLPVRPIEEREEIEARLEEDPDDAALLAGLAQVELREGELEAAEDAARRALEHDRDQTAALEVISHVLIAGMLREKDEAARGKFIDQVEPYLRSLIDLAPENAAAIKYLGYVAQSRKRPEEAIQRLSRYQRRFPADPDPYRRLAAIYLRQGDVNRALAQLERLSHRVEDEPAVALQIASIRSDRGRPDLAVHWYRQAIEIDPYDADTHASLANAYLEMGRHADAEREYQALCGLLPEEGVGYRGLSRVYRAMGNLTEAAAYQKKADALEGKIGGGDRMR